MTIFEKLFSAKICFAVVVSVDKYKTVNIDVNQSDWFILIHVNDKPKIKNITAQSSSTSYKLLEISLCDNQVEQFKAIAHKFNKTVSNQYGRVYEIEGNSFKDYIKQPPQIKAIPSVKLIRGHKLIAKSDASGKCKVILLKRGFTRWLQISYLTETEILSWYRVGPTILKMIEHQLKIRELKLKPE